MKRLHLALITCAAFFFLLTAWFGRPVAGLWNSPDETANAFWATRVAQGSSLAVRDVVVGLGAGAIHPRSMTVMSDALIPGSFSGLFLLYGTVQRFLKIPFWLMTPLLTVLAGIFFGLAVSKLFDRRIGLWSAILFFLHPAVLYYAAHGLFHNVLFIDLLILSVSVFVMRKGRASDALGGFLFGWAMMTRTSEALWALPAFAAFLPFAGKERWRRLGWAVVGAALPIFVLLQMNASLYGSPFKTAYAQPRIPVVVEAAAPVAQPSVSAPASLVLPFGFHPKDALRRAWSYGVTFFWWQSLLAVAGLGLWLFSFRRATSPQKTYALMALLTAAWLAILYGSWDVRDRLDVGQVTIGTSYVRYFLPAYVAALPFAALALVHLGEKMKKPQLAALCAVICAFLTLRLTVFAGDENLRAVHQTLEDNAVKKQVLSAFFPPEAIIMTERFDKVLMPERLRIIPATDQGGFAAARSVIGYVPVYWYGLTPSAEELAQDRALAAESHLTMTEVASPIEGETTYRIDLHE